jgi:ribosomal protein S15P/S13E
VRRGALGGLFQKLVISLAQESIFDRLAPATEKQKKERVREELVTRFFAYGDGLESYRDRVSDFLFSYTKKMNTHFKEYPEDVHSYRERFINIMQFVERNFLWGFRRTKNGKVTPRARFEAIAIGSYYALQQNPDLANSSLHVDDWLSSNEFKEITGADGANAIGRLKGRINFVRDQLLGE